MATIFVQEGGSIDYIPPTDTPAGTVVVMGELVGVVRVAIKANKLGALAVEGIFDFPTRGDMDWTDGQRIYWMVGEQLATGEAGEEFKYIGKLVNANPRPGLAYIRVRMSQ